MGWGEPYRLGLEAHRHGGQVVADSRHRVKPSSPSFFTCFPGFLHFRRQWCDLVTHARSPVLQEQAKGQDQAVRQRHRQHPQTRAAGHRQGRDDRRLPCRSGHRGQAAQPSTGHRVVCVLRCKYHFYMASGIPSQAIKAGFPQHANEEQGHADLIADLIAERIAQLDGSRSCRPRGCSAAAMPTTSKARICST